MTKTYISGCSLYVAFLSTQKTYHGLCGNISRAITEDAAVTTSWDNDLRSWGAGLKPIILSLILLKCCGDAGGILCGHYSRVKFVNLGAK